MPNNNNEGFRPPKSEYTSGGIFYEVDENVKMRVCAKGETQVKVWFDHEGYPPSDTHSGSLSNPKFRAELTEALAAFDTVPAYFGQLLGYLDRTFHDDLREHAKAAESNIKTEKEEPGLSDSIYDVMRGGFVRVTIRREEEYVDALTNFVARIVRDVREFDGVESVRRFHLEAQVAGSRKVSFSIPAAAFNTMNWVHDNLGAGAVIYPSPRSSDHARTAIQLLSNAKTEDVWTHTGWVQIDGRHAFLHAGGAIDQVLCPGSDPSDQVSKPNLVKGAADTYGENDPADQVDQVLPVIEVRIENALRDRELPPVPAGEKLREAIRASLQMLELAPDTVTVPLFAATYRAPLGASDFSLHVEGESGVGKSELAALAQQHYGRALDSRQLSSWHSTAYALEAAAFLLKDEVMVIDDLKPAESLRKQQELNSKTDQVLRAKGNNQGRQRLRPDGTLRPVKPPRALIISTGEDSPAGHSLTARLFITSVGPKAVDFGKLTEAQGDARNGLYAAAMAGYVSYLVGHKDGLEEKLAAHREELRAHAADDTSHKRTPGIAADLGLGLWWFLRYARSAGALSKDEAKDIWARGLRAIDASAAAQSYHQKVSEPTSRFFEALSEALASGAAHVVDANGGDNGAPVGKGDSWGWRLDEVGENSTWRAQGRRIGYLDGDDLYLLPGPTMKVARAQTQDSGGAVTLSDKTMSKRLRDKGLLKSTGADVGDESIAIRKTLGGERRRFLHTHKYNLEPLPSAKPGQPGQQGEKADTYRSEPRPGSVFKPGQLPDNLVTKPGQWSLDDDDEVF